MPTGERLLACNDQSDLVFGEQRTFTRFRPVDCQAGAGSGRERCQLCGVIIGGILE
jgi:hypothetical protein